jgi:hypothetical protein
MQDDVRNLIFIVFALFIVVLVLWIGFVFVAGCGFDLACEKAADLPERTAIPTLIPADLPVMVADQSVTTVSCQIHAVSLIGEWVKAGYSETEPFSFTDLNGQSCTATFTEDVQPLFLEANLWYSGAPACTTCHNPTLGEATAAMDLSTYQGILLGSRRAGPDQSGNDILGSGDWESSLMYTQLFVLKAMPQGRPPDVPAEGPVIFAGSVAEQPSE